MLVYTCTSLNCTLCSLNHSHFTLFNQKVPSLYFYRFIAEYVYVYSYYSPIFSGFGFCFVVVTIAVNDLFVCVSSNSVPFEELESNKTVMVLSCSLKFQQWLSMTYSLVRALTWFPLMNSSPTKMLLCCLVILSCNDTYQWTTCWCEFQLESLKEFDSNKAVIQ